MAAETKSFYPAPPDLAGRLPSLDRSELNQGAEFRSLAEQRARYWSLARFIAGVILWPWICWRVALAGWLGPVDVLVIGLAGEVVCIFGAVWAWLPYRQDVQRERLRLHRAALENQIMTQGYGSLLAGYDQAVRRVYGRPARSSDQDVMHNLDPYRKEVIGLSARFDEFAADLAAQVRDLAAQLHPAPAQPATLDADTVQLQDVSALAGEYYDSPLERLVLRVLRGEPVGLRALTTGEARYMTRGEYESAMARFSGAGVFVSVAGKSHQPAPDLVVYSGQWFAAETEAQRREIEDSAHTWAVGRLAGVGPVAARVAPPPPGVSAQ